MLAILLVPKPSSPIENNLLQTLPETVLNSSYIPLPKSMLLLPNEGVKDMPLYSLPLIDHQTSVKYYTSLAMKISLYLSMNHLGSTIDLVSLEEDWFVPKALSLGHFPHVLLPKVMIPIQLI